ncbi:MAG: hypothetical protein ACRD9S_25090, partial [Pyrinomonadaceae bacterium]
VLHVTPTGQQVMELTNTGSISLLGSGDDGGAQLDGTAGRLTLGGNKRVGEVVIRDAAKQKNIVLDAATASVRVGHTGAKGDVFVLDVSGRSVFHLDGDNATLSVGALGNEGDIIVRDGEARPVLRLDGNSAVLIVGAQGNAGDIVMRDVAGRDAVRLAGDNALFRLGDTGNGGDIIVRDNGGRDALRFSGNSALLRVGANGNFGNISVRDGSDREVFDFNGANAVLRIGSTGNEGDIVVRNNLGAEVIHLDGGTGDIILSNADCAEDFDVSPVAEVEPGMVMVLSPEGSLRPSTVAYDKTVAGVISGAGEFKPGIVLDRHSSKTQRIPLALVGKVYCKVDASYSSIEVGDLLTTSATPGHAMKATEPQRAFGAVIGKALKALPVDRGLIPILVALQ